MLKLKTPLLALSISTALLAPQLGSAQPLQILPLGDSITNGVYNPIHNGNTLAYRDDLYDLLVASGKTYGTDFEFTGTCIPVAGTTDYTGELGGECVRTGTNIAKGDGVTYKGVKLRHEGRAGWHASDINASNRLPTWLDYYYADIALVHLGTNDIFQQENDSNKNDNIIEPDTYLKTLEDIEGVIAKLKADESSMKIYIAKILPMGKIHNPDSPDADDNGAVLYGGTDGDDAAKGLNNLMTPAWAAAQGVTVVDMNTGFNFNGDLDPTGMIHPTLAGEAKMADRWYNAAFGGGVSGVPADPSTSSLSANKTTISADNNDSAIITLDAKDASGNNLSNPSIEFIINNSDEPKISLTPSVKNSDGTYSVSLKNNNYLETLQYGGAVVVVKVNGVTLKRTDGNTAYVLVKFLTGQTITFNPPSTMAYAEEKVLTDNVKSLKFGTTTTTNLKVLVEVDPTSSAICKIDAANKLVIKSTAKKDDVCKLNASQAGGTENGITYGAAAAVSKEITVVRANQTITFDANTPSTGFIGEVFTVKAVSTSGLNVAYTATPSNVCSIDGNAKVILKATGTCKVTASQAGNTQYKVAHLSFANITVSNDKVTLPTIADKTFGVKPFAVTAKSSAGAAVTLTATPAKVCKVSGNTVTVVGAGECTLTAKTAHAEATTSFTIKKKETSAGGGGGGVDKENSDSNKSGGSISALWLLMLGFVGLFRRKS